MDDIPRLMRLTMWRLGSKRKATTMAAAGLATDCTNSQSKNEVVSSSQLENVDADKPLPRRFSGYTEQTFLGKFHLQISMQC